MVTVVVVATCLTLALRVFSTCAAAVSESYNTNLALNILEEKMAELLIRSISQDGIESSSQSDEISLRKRRFAYYEEIIEWEMPAGAETEEESGEEPREESEEEEPEITMSQATLRVSWSSGRRPRNLTVSTLLPAKGFAHEF